MVRLPLMGTPTQSDNNVEIQGTHTYAEAGSYAVSVTVTDNIGYTLTINPSDVNNATVADAPISLQGGESYTVTDGSTLTAGSGQPLAVLTDSDTLAPSSGGQYEIVVNWGDGQTDVYSTDPSAWGIQNNASNISLVSLGNGQFDIEGSHTYNSISMLATNPNTISVTVYDTATSAMTTDNVNVQTTITIIGNESYNPTEGTALNTTLNNNPPLAVLTDANASTPTSGDQYEIVVNWGDGQTDTYSPDPSAWNIQPDSNISLVSLGNGQFDVEGSHIYQDTSLLTNNPTMITINAYEIGGANTLAAPGIDYATVTDAPISVQGGQSYTVTQNSTLTAGSSQPLAILTDSNTYAPTSGNQYEVVVNWGDGQTDTYSPDPSAWGIQPDSNISLVSLGNGQFDIEGTHAYGTTLVTPEITVNVYDSGGSNTLASPALDGINFTASTVSVTGNESYTIQEGSTLNSESYTVPEGSTIDQPLAVLTDSNTSASSSGDQYSVIVTWGDGQTDVYSPDPSAWGIQNNSTNISLVSLGNGQFDIEGTHVYQDISSLTTNPAQITVNVFDIAGTSTVSSPATDTATVTDASISETAGPNYTLSEGSALNNSTLAVLTDQNPYASASDYTVTVNWGDGTSDVLSTTQSDSNLSIVATSTAGVFDIVGSHSYYQMGSDQITVNVSDSGGSQANQITDTVTVTAPTLTFGSPITFYATENQTTNTIALATFTDSNSQPNLNDYSATINWGDGTTTTIAPDDTGTNNSQGSEIYEVESSHTYTAIGTDSIVVTVYDNNTDIGSVTDTAIVAKTSKLTVDAKNISVIQDDAFSATVATFTDTNHAETVGDFTATITWGDGTTSTGTIVADVNGSGNVVAGKFDVIGYHTYTNSGKDLITVTVTDTASAPTVIQSDSSNTKIAPAIKAKGQNFSENAGSSTNVVVATFTEQDGASLSDISATINWGNGVTTPGTLLSLGNDRYEVTGQAPYQIVDSAKAQYTVTTSITDNNGGSAEVTSKGVVKDVIAKLSSVSLNETAGTSFTNVVVATFTDDNLYETAGDFSAIIDWGSGAQTAETTGIIMETSPGNFVVEGSNEYFKTGNHNIKVKVIDQANVSRTITSHIDVSDGSGGGSDDDISLSGESPSQDTLDLFNELVEQLEAV